MIGESSVPKSAKELWYDNQYVSKQLERIQRGKCFRLFFTSITYVNVSGEWSEMHNCKSLKGDITPMKRGKAVGERAVKLALFRDSSHEGVESIQDPELLVLFEPGPCLRGRG